MIGKRSAIGLPTQPAQKSGGNRYAHPLEDIWERGKATSFHAPSRRLPTQDAKARQVAYIPIQTTVIRSSTVLSTQTIRQGLPLLCHVPVDSSGTTRRRNATTPVSRPVAPSQLGAQESLQAGSHDVPRVPIPSLILSRMSFPALATS